MTSEQIAAAAQRLVERTTTTPTPAHTVRDRGRVALLLDRAVAAAEAQGKKRTAQTG
jgi:hypothetical protein